MRRGDWAPWRRTRGQQQETDAPVCYCVVDPSAATVRVLIVEVSEDHTTIWGWNEIDVSSPAARQPRALAALFERSLSRAEAAAQDRTGRWLVADHVVVGLPVSQLRGWAWPVRQRRSQPRLPVDERELETLLGRALRLAVNRQIGMRNRGWLLVDALPASMTVDDLGVTDPVGFRGREIAVSVFAALAQKGTVEMWRIVAEELRFATLDLMAAPLALAASLAEPQGLLVDIGEVTTDLTWWRGGCPIALDSWPIGGAAMTKALLRQWQLSEDKAESLKRAYADGQLRSDAESQVREVLSPVLEEWRYQAERALANMSQAIDQPLPHRIYLCGGGSALGDMLQVVRLLVGGCSQWFDRAALVEELQPKRVPGIVNRTEFGQDAGDVPALALAAWAGRQDKSADRPSRMLRKLCQA